MTNSYESISRSSNGFTKPNFFYKVEVTPDMARKMLRHNNHNRPIRKELVLSYRKQIESGEFAYTGDSIRFDVNGNMIDGQHRCMAVEYANIPIICNVETGLPLSAYAKMDQGRRRTAGDMLHSYDIPNSKVVGAAITLLINMENKQDSLKASVPNSVIDTWVRKNPELLSRMIDSASRAGKIIKTLGRKLSQNHITTLLFLMRERNENKALLFFETLADYGSVPMAKDNPIYQLYQRLYKPGPESKRIDRVEALALTIKAYSLWLKDKKISRLSWTPGKEGFPKIP